MEGTTANEVPTSSGTELVTRAGSDGPESLEEALGLVLGSLAFGNEQADLVAQVQQIERLAPVDAPWVDEAIDAVVCLGRKLSAARSREAELLSLLDTARDLTRTSVEAAVLLRTIVDRARDTVMAHSALLCVADDRYLPLFNGEDESSALKIASGGSKSWAASGRAKFSAGIARICIQTRQPYASRDYMNDPQLKRDPKGEEIAALEGIRGIVGTPLCVADHVIGILFVADRRPRDWTDNEVGLIASMANQAAAAMENAYLFLQLEATVDQLTVANAEILEHRDQQARAIAVHDELMALALGGSDIQTFATSIGRLIEASVVIVDDQLAVRAKSTPASGTDILEVASGDETVIAAIRESVHATLVPVRPGSGRDGHAALTAAVIPVKAGKRSLGALLALQDKAFDTHGVRVLESAGHVLALLLLLEDSLAVAETQVRGELVDDLLGERPVDVKLLRRRGQQMGFDPWLPQVVVVATLDAKRRDAARSSAGSVASRHAGITGEHDGYIVFVLSGSDADQLTEMVRVEQSRATHQPVTVAGVGPVTGVDAIREGYRDAIQCLHMMRVMGREGESATVDQFGVLGLLLGEVAGERLQNLAQRALGPLLSYDAEHQTELVATVDAYFSSGQIPSVAAGNLYVHQNTVYQRLARIDEILGNKRWREPEGALEMQIALRAIKIMRTQELSVASDPPDAKLA